MQSGFGGNAGGVEGSKGGGCEARSCAGVGDGAGVRVPGVLPGVQELRVRGNGSVSESVGGIPEEGVGGVFVRRLEFGLPKMGAQNFWEMNYSKNLNSWI